MKRFINAMCLILATLLLPWPAVGQTVPGQLPADDREFHELLCRMVVGNVQSKLQLQVQLYRNETFTWTDGSYGLLTGFYTGDRGVSVHGPDLDDPKAPRYLKNGMQIHNADVARLRAAGSAFRQGVCDAIEPDPDPEPKA